MILSKVVASARATGSTGVARRFFGAKGSRGWDWYYNYKEKAAEGPVEATPFPDSVAGAARKKAFLDIKIADEDKGRIVIELADDLVPRASQNFLDLCQGVAVEGADGAKADLTYKGTKFHTNRKGYIIQGGDVDGRGGRCAPQHATDISGYFFQDENVNISHSVPGIVSMATPGAHTNGSQFFITVAATPWLDGKHTVFGRVVSGMNVVSAIENCPCDRSDRPLTTIKILSVSTG